MSFITRIYNLFYTGSHYVSLAKLELTRPSWPWIQRAICLCLCILSAGIKGWATRPDWKSEVWLQDGWLCVYTMLAHTVLCILCVHMCTVNVCELTWVWRPQVDTGFFLHYPPPYVLRQGLSLNPSSLIWLNGQPASPGIPVSYQPCSPQHQGYRHRLSRLAFPWLLEL